MACHPLTQLRHKLALVLLAAMLAVAPLKADLSGYTTTPLNFPSSAIAVTLGPDGNIWMVADNGNLARLTPSGTYTEFPVPWGTEDLGGGNTFAIARDLTTGIDGNLWLIGINGHVGRMTTAGVFTDFTVASGFGFNDPVLVKGADGALWFFDGSSNNWKMDRIDIYGQVTSYPLGLTNAYPMSLISGADGNLWFIELDSNQMMKFSLVTNSLAGTFPIPNLQLGQRQIVLGWDGNLWFPNGPAIDRVKPDGTITAFPVPSGGNAGGITMSGDGNLLFTEPGSGRLGELVLSSVNGTSATVNETLDSVESGVDQLLPFPGTFSSSGKVAALDSGSGCGQPCHSWTYLVRIYTQGKGNLIVLVMPPPSMCADVLVSTLLMFADHIYVVVANAGPDDADNVTTKLIVSPDASVTAATPGELHTPEYAEATSATVSVVGNSVTLNGPLNCGQAYAAVIALQPTSNTQSARVTAIATGSVPDPNPVNNFKADSHRFLSIGDVIPPDQRLPITVPVQRGGH